LLLLDIRIRYRHSEYTRVENHRRRHAGVTLLRGLLGTRNRLLVFADDTQPCWITASTMIDYTTVARGDRFGNIFVNRLDTKVFEQIDDDPTGASILHEKGVLMGAPHKTKMICHFHVGDLVTSINKISLVAGGGEVLLYTGLHGTIGILVPFVSKEDVDFISTLEQHMRTEQGSLVGRDHLRLSQLARLLHARESRC
jgi:splicing factor 3B subunit 3